MVMAATSAQHAINAPPHLPNLLSSLPSSPSTRPIDPYSTPLRPVETFSQGLKPIQVKTLDVKEAMGVFEVWREERLLGAESKSQAQIEREAAARLAGYAPGRDFDDMDVEGGQTRGGLSRATAHGSEGSSKSELKRLRALQGGKSGAGDERFLGTYAESGGNAREFVWKGLLSSLAG